MHVICKQCRKKIAVAGRPSGSTSLRNVQLQGDVRVEGGAISFGPGGSISFGPGGALGFGDAEKSSFICPACGTVAEYAPNEILND